MEEFGNEHILYNCFFSMVFFTFVPFFLGVEILNKAISKLTSKGGGVSGWRTILIEISVSNIRITDCTVSCSLSIFSPKIM